MHQTPLRGPKPRSLFPDLGTRPRVLVPVLRGQMARPIVSIGDALLAFPGATGNLLALVEAAPSVNGRLVTQDERRREMLRWVAGLDYESHQRRRMKVTLRVTADVVSSIRDVVAETEATSVVLEWPTALSPRRHRLSALTAQLAVGLSADILFVRSDALRPDREIAPRSILAPMRGGPSARIVAATAVALADAYGCALTLLHVRSQTEHPDRSRREWETFERIVDEIRRPATVVRQLRGDAPAGGILEQSAAHDLVIIGSRLNPAQPQLLIGRGLLRTVRRIHCPVMVIRPTDTGWWTSVERATRHRVHR